MSNIVQINDENGRPQYYDFGTKNKSFLLTCQELKTLGIKNWYFPLLVKYPQLGIQDLDPHSPDLTPEQIGRIHIESKTNIWYWLRECAKVPARGAPRPYDVCLTRASCAATWCYEHNIDFMICQPRQTYKTTIVELLTTHAYIYELKNVDIPFMHIRENDTLRNAEMFRDYVTALPPYMNPWYGRNKLPGLKSLKYDEHGTTIKILSSADSEVKAKDKMRGMTLFVGFVDEYEYIPYISSVIAGAAPAIISGRNIARETGGRTCMMYASTPGDLETSTGKEAQRMIDMTPPFSEHMYDLTPDEIDNMFNGLNNQEGAGSSNPVSMLYIEFNHIQLRKDDVWLREQYNEAVRTGKLAEYRRGVLLQRFRGGDSELFRQEDIDYLQEHVKSPDYEIFIMKKYHLYVYKHTIIMSDINSDTPYFDITVPYLIGIDVASGGGGDNTAICIVHPYTLEVVGELLSPYMGTLDLMRVITQLAILIPKGIFCVETNNVGKAIVDFVQESQLESRFYHDPQLNISKNPIMKDNPELSLKFKAKQKGYIGTYVTPTVRNEMFTLLTTRMMKDYRHLLLSKYLVKDITNLVKSKSGKIQADDGEHDDMVMAYLHTIYVFHYGHDLTRFGIDKKECTFEKAYNIIDEYEQTVQENTVDNMKPYDHPTMYEEQLLHDLTSSDNESFSNDGGTDIYGYTKRQYQQNEQLQRNTNDLSMSDVAFFRELNSY